jgi:ubiquinone/menaquinone biosynthesis C-methylase UbiE
MSNPISQSVDRVRRRYDRLAPAYPAALSLFLLPRRARRLAVQALSLEPGGRALEVGCGSGRNLPLLAEAVGPTGAVYGVDVSTGMLRRAKRLVDQQGLSNVELRVEDAAQLAGPDQLDAVLFGLSYAMLPEPRTALAACWDLVRPGGRVVIVEGRLPDNLLGCLLRRPAAALSRLTVLGDPDARGWKDLADLSPDVETRWLQFGTHYISSAVKTR